MARISTLYLIDKMADAALLQSMYEYPRAVDSVRKEEFKAMIQAQWPTAGSIFNTKLIPSTHTVLATHDIADFDIAESRILFITIYYLDGTYGIKLQNSEDVSFWIPYQFGNLSELDTKIRECKRSIHDLILPNYPWYFMHEGNPLP